MKRGSSSDAYQCYPRDKGGRQDLFVFRRNRNWELLFLGFLFQEYISQEYKSGIGIPTPIPDILFVFLGI